jgi:hypothetical protein
MEGCVTNKTTWIRIVYWICSLLERLQPQRVTVVMEYSPRLQQLRPASLTALVAVDLLCCELLLVGSVSELSVYRSLVPLT